MKVVAFLLSFLVIQTCLAQSGTDTLHFGNKIYLLQKVKKNYSIFQSGIPYIPVEYSEYKKELSTTYISAYDSSYIFEMHDDGRRYMVMKPESENLPKKLAIYLGSFLDTLKIKTEELASLKIYITSKGKRIYFSAFQMVNCKNGIAKDFSAGYIANGDLFASFDFFNSGYREHQLKNSSFFITDLYYQRGGVTYFLDRNFIIVCE